jgi:hypothetical protein
MNGEGLSKISLNKFTQKFSCGIQEARVLQAVCVCVCVVLACVSILGGSQERTEREVKELEKPATHPCSCLISACHIEGKLSSCHKCDRAIESA